MTISGAQLTAWAGAGPTVSSAATYASVQAALRVPSSPVYGRAVDIYLQGSYANHTNTRGDSDVDVVVQLNDNFYGSIVRLPADQQIQYNALFVSHPYTWSEFRRDVFGALQAYYGSGVVQERDKCITIASDGRRLSADVVVATQYQEFRRFYSWADEVHETGITFWTQNDGRPIINWPKQHIENGEEKNGRDRTGGRYKPAVRIFKNARAVAVDKRLLSAADAPSFFLECLIHNVPDACFTSSDEATTYAVLDWLHGRDVSGFYCGNGIVPLFGPKPEQWSLDAAYRTIGALVKVWNDE